MSVDSRLVKDVLVREILRRAEAHAQRGEGASLAEGNSGLARAEDSGLAREPESGLARLGYCTRLAETELFEPARAPMPGLAERIGSGAATDVSRELASAEPAGRPEPDDGAPSWQVPGPGGHVRHYVASLAAEQAAPDMDPAEAKRAFMLGFFLRCCEEAA
jgi:hypothetical protein